MKQIIGLTVGFVFALSLGFVIGNNASNIRFEKEAIAIGFGTYDVDSLKFKWNKPVVPVMPPIGRK